MGRARYLLDTNILSDLIRHPAGAVAGRIAEVGESAICTSIIVACELRYDAEKKGSPKLTDKVEQLLLRLETFPLAAEADRHYTSLRKHLQSRGMPIGSNDLLIAAHALALDLTLVTDNGREFRRVPELTVENWLMP